MMRWILLTVTCSTVVLAQTSPIIQRSENSFSVFCGMSVNAISASDINDYVNSVAIYTQHTSNFSSAVDFFGGVEFPLDELWGLKVEYTYLFKSYNFSGFSGETYEFFYGVHAPNVLVQRVITGDGFFIKLGAGGGYHLAEASQTISTYGISSNYNAKGVGFKTEAIGETAFDEKFYGYIGCDVGWELLGSLTDTTTKKNLAIINNQQSVRLNYFFAGIRFGITYYL